MIDPRHRGKRAQRALAMFKPEMKQLVEEIVLAHASHADGEGGALLDNAKAVVRRKDVTDWCKEVASDGNRSIWPADAAAAVAAAYFQAVLETQPLFHSYTNQVAAILVHVLKEAVYKMKLRLFLDHYEPRSEGNGLSACEPDKGKAFVWQKIYVPLAGQVLISLASLRLTDELNGPDSRTVYPFAWVPGLDSLQRALEFMLLGQALQGGLHAGFVYSRFVRYVVRAGYAAIVPFQTFHCCCCRRRIYKLTQTDTCTACGSAVHGEIRPQCLSTAYLNQCAATSDSDGRLYYSAVEVAPAT
ncbi:MAG: hypothetical protein HQ592_05010 [Planctomycetes bacterium]|nr:hypothetical protein [Planctomycetota bacterium]